MNNVKKYWKDERLTKLYEGMSSHDIADDTIMVVLDLLAEQLGAEIHTEVGIFDEGWDDNLSGDYHYIVLYDDSLSLEDISRLSIQNDDDDDFDYSASPSM